MEIRSKYYMIISALLTVVLWQVPIGNYLLYPFTILATWFHEMSHGLTAIILGGEFKKLIINSDGSGLAFYSGNIFFGDFGRAFVAAAGALGPPFAGALLIISSRWPHNASALLKAFGGLLIFSAILWIRSLFGVVAILLISLFILFIAFRSSSKVQIFTIQFLGVQACISTLQQIGYLFTYSAGPLGLSDTGYIQKILVLPYWFWGLLITLLSFFVLIHSLNFAYRKP
jgi:hypothetical protein